MTEKQATAMAEWLVANGVDRADVVPIGSQRWGVECYLGGTLIFTLTFWREHFSND